MKSTAFSNYKFYIGRMRYGGGWLVGASHNDVGDELAEAFDDLDAGDFDASQALEYIKEHAKFYSHGDTPSQALKSVEDQITEYIESL
ncbi:hypothetical protein [Acinetobacter sp. 102]|uniref:hypothetical protein n=1 Tax=Acinetobacter sp. 102 TaxID=3098766 RepID=UPI0030092695